MGIAWGVIRTLRQFARSDGFCFVADVSKSLPCTLAAVYTMLLVGFQRRQAGLSLLHSSALIAKHCTHMPCRQRDACMHR